MWRDLVLFGEHTWGAADSVGAPAARQTVAQWEYKRRFIDGADWDAIATEMGLPSRDAARMLWARSREKLADLLQGDAGLLERE